MFNRYFLIGAIGLGVMIGYNVWMIQRDQKLFESYYQYSYQKI